MRTLLDGRYREVRDLVRHNLAEHAQVLLDQEQMTTTDFRERVRDVVVTMAGTGQTGMGFPEEYGGGGDIGASVAAFETLAFGDLSVLVKVGVQFGLFGGAILQLGTKRHHDALLPDLITGRLRQALQGKFGVIRLLQRCPPEDHDLVSDEFVQRPVPPKNHVGHGAEIFIELINHVFRRPMFTERGEPNQIGK